MSETTMTRTKAVLEIRMTHVKEALEENPERTLVFMMGANKVLWNWLHSTGLWPYVESMEDMPLLKPFWVQLKKLGFEFNEAERQEIFQDWLDD